MNKKIFACDYDGTLAKNDGFVSESTEKALRRIGEMGIIRVVATGRSFYSFNCVNNSDFPIDYLVFSSGVGVYCLKTKRILKEGKINESQTNDLYNFLVEKDYDFTVQLPVPNNHSFYYRQSGKNNPDFMNRVNLYKERGVGIENECPRQASQFIVICAAGEEHHFNIISEKFRNLNVVKATSPMDGKSLWVEIFPKNISKSSGIDFIRDMHKTDIQDVVSVGNDYYDLDMLNYTLKSNSYIVANSPDDLKEQFNIIDSNENDGVAKLLNMLYK